MKILHDLITTFQGNFNDWLLALGQHVQLSLLSLFIAILIALPVTLILSRSKRLSEALLQVTGIFQTIPSLALLGLFIPIMGIGTMPALTALVIYALFPIVQGILTGMNSIDPSLNEAGIAFGMTRWERLKTYILPISMPIILAGIRTAGIMIIGTATLGALIGAGGLGSFIMLGIDRNDSSLILIGAISSALLAFIFSFLLKKLEKASLKTIILSILIPFIILLGTLLAPVINQFSAQRETVVIAGKLGAEPDILINMYKELIETNTDHKVELKPNFGKTSFLYEAVKSGDIDIYPEFTGTIVSSLLKDPPKVSTDSKEVYEVAKKDILKQDNLALLKPMQYQNTYALAVRGDYAKEHNLKTISDLARVSGQPKAGFSLEFTDRQDGYPGLKRLYGMDLAVQTMEPSLRYQALNAKKVDVIDVYSTDSQIKQYGLVVLKDDRGLFPPYQGAPLMKEDFRKKHPEIVTALNKLAGKITEEEMSEMNYKVDQEGKSAKSVAHEYLKKEGLVK